MGSEMIRANQCDSPDCYSIQQFAQIVERNDGQDL